MIHQSFKKMHHIKIKSTIFRMLSVIEMQKKTLNKLINS